MHFFCDIQCFTFSFTREFTIGIIHIIHYVKYYSVVFCLYGYFKIQLFHNTQYTCIIMFTQKY